ncbi:MAG: MBL fold metallo-hydrolase [Bacteroidales bacterium]|jgi:glyoxylase-like metal-dependent hydrolase (beta-lactamase superfamily II)|nr:MBL fold metallo-hydrolase [Bacteroidales bacterium]MCK9499201.1 MBL fold metallo-hydrolase [Bacteroidales bacterium]MDY0314670.1 MBL fold metallo-hydrolase [Bacteroidales bacterium]NLB85586.1 MBL fold metallo-hydrolase [Bacteroidales bacterium]
MKIIILDTPEFKIDGGAYFGVVPKIIWQKKYPCDENNMCAASCRSILVDDGKRVILFDTGIGEEPEEKTKDLYFTDYSQNLEINLKKQGYLPEQITDVVLTHLHFDHCGGNTKIDKNTRKKLIAFPNAEFYVSKDQFENANNPNYRERSSYMPENWKIIQEAGKLNIIEKEFFLTNEIELKLFYGHTAGLMLPIIRTKDKTIFFTGDLIPARASVPLAWVSAYDLFPLTSIEEKQKILNQAADENWLLVFQHDYYCEACYVEKTERGVRAKEAIKFLEI